MRTRILFACSFLLTLGVAIAPAAAQNRTDTELAEPSRQAPTGDARLAAMSGSYRLVSGHPSVQRAVDAVCDRLDFLTRAFARPILEDRNRPYDHVELALDRETALFTLGPWGPVRSRLGVPRSVRNERGEMVRVHQHVARNGQLVQTFTTDQGTRQNTWTASPDGRTVTIETRITSPRLPIPLRYRLVLVREL